MGSLDEDHLCVEIENGMKVGFEEEPETIAIEDAVKVLLQGLGEDVNRKGIVKTPLRVAKALRQGTRGYKQKVKDVVEGALFPEAGLHDGVGHAGGLGGIVIVRDLDLFSYCESCLLPFQLKCHVGYVPSGQRVVGLSKLSRVADVFAKRLQDPQRLADEICSALHHGIKPAGVAVILEYLHFHFPNVESVFLDSKHQGWVKVLVSSGSGIFGNENTDAWVDFLGLLKFRGVTAEKILTKDSAKQNWCPSHSSPMAKIPTELEADNPEMVAAVASILRSLGEDPSRKELVETPGHFVRWLVNFQDTKLEMKLNGFACGITDLLKPNGEVGSRNNKHMHSELNLSFWSQFDSTFLREVQERLTRQIAETVSSILGGDVMVVVEANHTCMISRGIEKFGSNTATIAVLGQFATDPAARAMLLLRIPDGSQIS
ncbi:GTP cyclohydrolase 1 [Hibiscus syriacus]|uniref:GTP cyclohydrolase 1 n=1 Tax=Hibiscus syriacus TaxID=106335 RepID=A0A6A2Z380_HIBSY|nr:GTP cyclohydrolase 1 [Hibiscus syriacus]